MKKSKKMQILLFCLIPFGILILIFSIKVVRKNFSGDIILEIPYAQKSGDFAITKSGHYAIWHKGTFFRKAPLDEFRPVIINQSTGEETRLIPSLFRSNSNNGRTARMELFRFSLSPGTYRLELAEGSSISALENAFIRRFPARKVDPDQYFIQVRETQPFIYVVIGILLMILAAFCIIGGLVIGLLADQIFKTNH